MPHSTQLDKERIATGLPPESEAGAHCSSQSMPTTATPFFVKALSKP